MESKRMHTSICTLQRQKTSKLRWITSGFCCTGPSEAMPSVTQYVFCADYPQREAISQVTFRASLSRGDRVVGGKASSESHAINCPEGFPARIAMAQGKAPSNTEMRRCMRENAISRSKCGAEAPRALVAL